MTESPQVPGMRHHSTFPSSPSSLCLLRYICIWYCKPQTFKTLSLRYSVIGFNNQVILINMILFLCLLLLHIQITTFYGLGFFFNSFSLFICQSFQHWFLKYSWGTNEHDIFLKIIDWNSLLNQGSRFKKDTKYHRFTLEWLLSKLLFINM